MKRIVERHYSRKITEYIVRGEETRHYSAGAYLPASGLILHIIRIFYESLSIRSISRIV